MVSLGITYIYDLLQSTDTNISSLEWCMENLFPFRSFYLPHFKFSSIRWYNFCFSQQKWFIKLMARRMVYYIHLFFFLIFSFLLVLSDLFFYHFLSVCRIPFSHSVGVGLLVTNSFSFPLSENIFISPLSLIVLSDIEFVVDSFFL